MRILIVGLDFPPARGGILEWTYQVALQLSLRHDVRVLVSQPADGSLQDQDLPFDLVRYRTPASTDNTLLPLSALLLRYCRLPAPAIVVFTHLLAAAGTYSLLQRLRVPYAVVAHGQELYQPELRALIGATIQASCVCIANSQSTAEVLAGYANPRARITVIPPGVPVALLELTLTPQAADWLRRLVPPHVPVILTVARLDKHRKGHDMLLRALALIQQQFPEVLYVIAGDGRLRQEYEMLAASLALKDRVLFTGHIDDDQRLALYDRCDLFAMISREESNGGMEGFGIAFLEAAARGKPSIGGRSGGVPDAVVDGGTGLLVDPLSPESIAGACLKVLLDPALASRLGLAGRARVRDAFTWERIVWRIEMLLLRSLKE